MQHKRIKIAPNQLRASFVPNTWNEEKRTIDVVWTTGARGKRFSWTVGYYYEELSTESRHVDLSRLKSGASVLNNHKAYDLKDIIGVVESARMKDGEGHATIRFSERDELQGLIRDIKSGVIRNLSVGYDVDKYVELEEESDEGYPILRAVKWTPAELSFVTIPFDAGAQSRSNNNEELEKNSQEVILEQRGEKSMKNKNKKQKRQAEQVEDQIEDTAVDTEVEEIDDQEGLEEEIQQRQQKPIKQTAAPAPGPEDEEEIDETDEARVQQVRAAEATRQSEIRKNVRIAGLGEELADELCGDIKIDVQSASKRIFAELEKRNPQKTNNQRVEVTDMNQKQLRVEAATRGLLHRFDGQKYQMKEGEGEFVQGSILDMARHFLALEGVRGAYTMNRQELAKRALHSTSDFPEVLANTANRSLRAAYEGAPNTFMPFVRETSKDDFKQISSVQIGNGGKLVKVGESGEYKRTTLSESAEKYQIEKYGIVLGRTWELIVNDDMDAFTRIPARLGVRAKEKENEIFWGLVTMNTLTGQAMAETGVNLFHATHGNLIASGSGGAPDATRLGVARKSMRLMKDLDGELSGVTPSYLVVPAALETVAEQLVVQTISPAETSKTNPFGPGGRSKLDIVVESRLDAASATGWYVFSDKNKIAMAELARLGGKGPEIFVREGFDIDGMELKLRYCFGMKILDYRGFFRNYGA